MRSSRTYHVGRPSAIDEIMAHELLTDTDEAEHVDVVLRTVFERTVSSGLNLEDRPTWRHFEYLRDQGVAERGDNNGSWQRTGGKRDCAPGTY